jgi:hypothetical protein
VNGGRALDRGTRRRRTASSCVLAACLTAAVAGIIPGSAAAETNPPDIERARAEPAVVRVEADTVYYTGNFSQASSKTFDAAVEGVPRGRITRMVISSGGGDTVAGRHVGRWVRDMGVVVEVDVICFSSCADYVFPAGKARVIRADAFVGWHGNERQFDVIAARRGERVVDLPQLRRLVPEGQSPEQQRAFLEDVVRSIAVTQKDEADFYARLGLSDAFAVCAVGDDLEQRFGFEGRKGWGFSIDDMTRLGLTNVVYLGKGSYEKDSSRFRKYLAQISADDCLALLKP